MKASLGLRDIEREVGLRTFEHGPWDLAIGSLLLSFGIGILTGIYWLSAIAFPVGLPAMRDLARRVIAARVGRAAFRRRRERSSARTRVILAALVLVGAGTFPLISFTTRDAAPAWAVWLRSHFIVVTGPIWSGALATGIAAALLVRFVCHYPRSPSQEGDRG